MSLHYEYICTLDDKIFKLTLLMLDLIMITRVAIRK